MKRNYLLLLVMLPMMVAAQYDPSTYDFTPHIAKTYTNSNPYYKRSTPLGPDYYLEEYYVGSVNDMGTKLGWGQCRNIYYGKGVAEEIGYFMNGWLTEGYKINYYGWGPGECGYEYYKDAKCVKKDMYMIPVDALALLKKVEAYGKKKHNFTPLSHEYLGDFGKRITNQQRQNMRNSVSSSSISDIKALGALIGLGAVAVAGAKAIDNAEAKAYQEKQRKAERESNRSMSNVEIVEWGTLGSLAISHAMVQLRNKNNYDVNVTVGLCQDGNWSSGKIIYSDGERSDYISGVSDSYSTSIRVKANSMRKVYLKADSRGRPTHIRISSVR